MFTIHPLGNGGTLQLAGKMTVASLGEVRRAIETSMRAGHHVVLDLGELTLMDRHSAEFLSSQSEQGITLTECPPYLQRWIVPVTNGQVTTV